ncbi:MAG: diguanylate cyclase domain-containing protein [Sulfuricaulis sp.]
MRLLQRLSHRPDTEHQAAAIRIVIALAASTYMLIAMHMGYVPHSAKWKVLGLIAVTGVYCLGVTVHILARSQVCVTRRIISIAFDLGATTYCLFVLGEVGLPFLGMFMFNAIGNGLRFGTRYLYLACALGVLGFTFVMMKSDYWAAHQTLDAGILIAMLVVPMYVASLVRNLHAALSRLGTMATHDPLTELPNRQGFYDKVSQTLAISERNRASFAIIFVDLDAFRPVNDNLGHAAGDEMLRIVARRLHDHVRKGDVVARIGRDE